MLVIVNAVDAVISQFWLSAEAELSGHCGTDGRDIQMGALTAKIEYQAASRYAFGSGGYARCVTRPVCADQGGEPDVFPR